MDSNRLRTLNVANVGGYIMVLVVNILANALPLNGITTGELSDKYDNLFTPAGYVFSIWFIIYVLLGIFSVFQLLPGRRNKDFVREIGWLFFVSCIFNSAWIFLWHYEHIFFSLIIMFGLLGSLISIYLKLDIGIKDVETDVKRYVHLPFSVYLGWITVAPIANVAAFLVSNGWPAVGTYASYMTVFVISVAVILSLINIWIRSDIGYNLVLVWALGGIVIKQWGTSLIPYTAGIGAVIILITITWKKLSEGIITN
jgi:hypothetical protein